MAHIFMWRLCYLFVMYITRNFRQEFSECAERQTVLCAPPPDVTSLHASYRTKQSFHIYEGSPAFCATVGHNYLFTGD